MDHWTTNSRNFRTFLLLMQLEPGKITGRLRQARKECGLTQDQAAELADVHKRTIENYEGGRVPWDRLNDFARLYNRPVEWFLYGDDAISLAEEDADVAVLTGKVGELLERTARIEEQLAQSQSAPAAPKRRRSGRSGVSS